MQFDSKPAHDRRLDPRPAILLAALLLATACTSTPDSRDVGLRTEILAVTRAMEQAMARDDREAVASHYADDAVLLGPGGYRVEGREAIDAYWRDFGRGIAWKLDSFSLEGDLERGIAYQRGRSTLTYERDGIERTSVVEFALVWTRGDDRRWRITVDAYWRG